MSAFSLFVVFFFATAYILLIMFWVHTIMRRLEGLDRFIDDQIKLNIQLVKALEQTDRSQ